MGDPRKLSRQGARPLDKFRAFVLGSLLRLRIICTPTAGPTQTAPGILPAKRPVATMRSPTQATTTWLLIALFAVVSGIGDGFHFVPGSGHAVELPNGLYYFGLARPQGGPSADDGTCRVGRSQHERPLVLDEDECAICGHSSKGQSRAKAVVFPLVLPVGQDVPEIASFAVDARPLLPFHARAPPIS